MLCEFHFFGAIFQKYGFIIIVNITKFTHDPFNGIQQVILSGFSTFGGLWNSYPHIYSPYYKYY